MYKNFVLECLKEAKRYMKDNTTKIVISDVKKVPMQSGNSYSYEFLLDLESAGCVKAHINCDSNHGSYVYFDKYRPVNYKMLDSFYFDEIKENATAVVINESLKIDELSDWAQKVLDNYNMLKEQIVKSGFAKEQSISLSSGTKLDITLCSYGDIKDFSDIDYYMTNSEVIYSDESLFRIAENIVNEEKTKKFIEDDKAKLFSYYQAENLEHLLQMPYKSLDDMQIDTVSFFSDWHKDVYGYRPRGLKNECQRHINQEQNPDIDSDIDNDYEH